MLLLTKYTVLYKENEICCIILLSLPSRERGLKYLLSNFLYSIFKSLPSRERGLKYIYYITKMSPSQSLPSRERGLKLQQRKLMAAYFRRSLRGSVD